MEKRNLELEATIEAAPDDLASYLVYGDWLQQQGDPRGELIALQCAPRTPESEPELLRAEQALLSRHAETWLGRGWNETMDVTWSRGFVTSVSRLYGTVPVRGQLARVLRSAPARFIRALRFDAANHERRKSEQLALDEIVECGPLSSVSSLQVVADDPLNASRLNGALPNLRTLLLNAEDVVLDRGSFRSVEYLSVGELLDAVPILTGRWPRLESVALAGGEATRPAPPAVVKELLDGRTAPELRKLDLQRVARADDIIQALAESPRTPQLLELGFGAGDQLTAVGVRGLLKLEPRLERLEKLTLRNGRNQASLEQLRRVFGPRLHV